MPGFLPFYTGSTLTQAYRSAGEFQMQGARATAEGYKALGSAVGSVARTLVSMYAGGKLGSALGGGTSPSPQQVQQAEAMGASFGSSSPSGQQFAEGIANQQRLIQLQGAHAQYQDYKQTLDNNSDGMNTWNVGRTSFLSDPNAFRLDPRYR